MHVYPFSAVVGSDDLALALTLCAVSPEIGGVLVRGEKGTAKSTMVRAQAALLPQVTEVQGCRFACDPRSVDPACPDGPHPADAPVRRRPARLVELPVGATEDRVIGSLHMQRHCLRTYAEYGPGCSHRTSRRAVRRRGEPAARPSRRRAVGRGGQRASTGWSGTGCRSPTPARFVLIGSMNPEEGELRPQLLDRFGLAVEVRAPVDPLVRAEAVRRRLAFDADPAAWAQWADAEAAAVRAIVEARRRMPQVRLGDVALVAIAEVCAAFDVDGMRADLVTAKTAVAHAGLGGVGG